MDDFNNSSSHDQSHTHTSIFNPFEPSTTNDNNDFTYDFNVRGTDRHHRRGHHHRRHEQTEDLLAPKVHKIEPRAEREQRQRAETGTGDEADDSVLDIHLGAKDMLAINPDDESHNKRAKQHVQEINIANGTTDTMDSKTTDRVEELKDENPPESKSKVYVRGISADDIMNNVDLNNRKTHQDARTKNTAEDEDEDDKTKRQRIEKENRDLQRRLEATERQRQEDEITEVRTPTESAEKISETQKSTTTSELKPRVEVTAKAEVVKETIKEVKKPEKGHETAKAKSKPRELLARIRARIMKTVTDLRK